MILLTLLYLNNETDQFTGFIKPGALHRARWMAKLLYSIKIVLLKKQILALPKNIITKIQMKKMERFSEFVIYCYVPWWLKASISTAAASNDLNLIKDLRSYEIEDPTIAKAALTALNRHMWYLSEELIPFSLFSSDVTESEKMKIVEEICKYNFDASNTKRIGQSYGKPFFPKIPQDVPEDLSFFVGEDSVIFFQILNIDTSFLKVPIQLWNENKAYCDAKKVISNICVVNDAAERGVKLCHDFLSSSKKEDNLQNILQVVENARNEKPNIRQKKVKSKNWFLIL